MEILSPLYTDLTHFKQTSLEANLHSHRVHIFKSWNTYDYFAAIKINKIIIIFHK